MSISKNKKLAQKKIQHKNTLFCGIYFGFHVAYKS